MKPNQAVSLIESAYRLDCSTEQWLEGIAVTSSAALGSERGAMAFRYDASETWINSGAPALHGLTPQVLAYGELGYSNKLIAYTLGLSSSTIATVLGKARKKLGMAPGTRDES